MDALVELEHDEGFFQRNLLRTRISRAVINATEMERVGHINKTMKNIDMEKGTFEVDAIVIAKDIKNVVRQPKA